MRRYFFYGTLVDAEVRERVVGRAATHVLDVSEAHAPGWRAVYAAGKRYPVLVRAFGSTASGIIVDGVRVRVRFRLAAFETRYRLSRITVIRAGQPVAAWCFLPNRALRASHRPFALAAWRGLFRKDYLKRILPAP